MALLVTGSYETPQGITVGSVYWKWVVISVDVMAAQARAVLYPFKDAQAATDKKQPIGPSKEYIVSGEDFVTMAPQLEGAGSGLSSVIYDYVKAHDDYFTKAVGV